MLKKQKIKKVIKGLTKASKTHAKQAKTLKGVINGGSKSREREKSLKVQVGGSIHDENPKDTVGIKFATPTDARKTVAKVKKISKPFARKIQILTVGEQRAKVMGKTQVAAIFKKGKESIRNAKGNTRTR